MLLEHIQDKSLNADQGYPASCYLFDGDNHEQQLLVVLSCLQRFHQTIQIAMSSINELGYSPMITRASMLPYIELISK